MFIPLGSDWKSGRRPWATLGLIAVNVLAYVVVWPFEDAAAARANARYVELLQVEAAVEGRFLPRRGPRRAGPFGFVLPSRTRERTPLEEEFWGDFEAGNVLGSDDELYLEWAAARAAYREAQRDRPYHDWTMHDGVRNPFAILSAMFLHFGFTHLLFNMIFLWAVAVNIEDVWGPGPVVLLYVLTGITAEFAHFALVDDTTAFGAGASGAVAGLMGAFLVRHWKRKLRCFVLFTFSIWQVPAWILLGYWGLTELFNATSGGVSGVAHWAHVGGFAGGILLAVTLVRGRFEDVVRPELERGERARKVRAHLEVADLHGKRGDLKSLLAELEAAHREDPQAIEPVRRLVDHHLHAGDVSRLPRLAEELLRVRLQAGEVPEMLDDFRRLDAVPAVEWSQATLLKTARAVADHEPREAAQIAYRVVQSRPEEPLRSKALTLYADLLERLGATDQAASTRRLISSG